MAKGKKGYRTSGSALNAQYDPNFKDHNLAAINPLSQQFEPTDSKPVRQHAQMAGDAAQGGSGSLVGKLIKAFSGKKEEAKAPPKEDTTNRRKSLDKAIEGD